MTALDNNAPPPIRSNVSIELLRLGRGALIILGLEAIPASFLSFLEPWSRAPFLLLVALFTMVATGLLFLAKAVRGTRAALGYWDMAGPELSDRGWSQVNHSGLLRTFERGEQRLVVAPDLRHGEVRWRLVSGSGGETLFSTAIDEIPGLPGDRKDDQ